MKRTALLFWVVLLPIFLFGNAHGFKTPKPFKFDLNLIRNTTYAPKEILFEEWDGYHDAFVPTEKMVLNYGRFEFPRVMVNSMDHFSNYDGEWYHDMVANYNYNSHGLVSDFNVQAQLGPGEFMTIMTGECEYNSAGRIIFFEMYVLSDEGMALANRMEIDYDEWIMTHYYWDFWDEDEEDAFIQKVDIQLDNQQRMSTLMIYGTEDDGETWYLEGKMEMSYHPQDTSNIDEQMDYMSFALPFMMLMGDEESMLYGMVTEHISSELYGTNWYGYERFTFEYNNQLQRIYKRYFDPGYPAWYEYYRDTYSYDDHGNQTEILGEECIDGVYFPVERTTLSYIPYTSVADEVVPSADIISAKAYPLPFTDTVNIHAESKAGGMVDVDIYNLKGQLVYSYSQPSGQSFVWDGSDAKGQSLPSAVYLMKVSQGKESKTAKILKVK